MEHRVDSQGGPEGPAAGEPAYREDAPSGRDRPPGTGVAAAPALRGGSRARRYLPRMLAAVVLILAGSEAGAAIALHYGAPVTTVTVSAPPAGRLAGQPVQPLAGAAAAVLPSVVTITVTTASGSGEGSGVILRSDGTIVTNDHVIAAVADGEGAITVTFAGGRSVSAVILGRDPSADIAVIRASAVTGATPARLGSASTLRVGDTVLAVGSPLGLSGTVTSGIVSALHRSITAGSHDVPSQELPGAERVLRDVIQTDTAINPGNSGGALVDAGGRVVGITTAIATVGGGYIGQQSGSIGVGFAIPIGKAYRVASRFTGG